VPFFGWLGTAMPEYPRTLRLQLQVRTQRVRVWLLLVLVAQAPRLYRERRDGISGEGACELSRAAM
jgi:hypothetical protein